jgi:hypothetical protein
MRRKRLIRSSLAIFALALSCFGAGDARAANYFPRDLRLGDEGRDVVNLQIALNVLVASRVAESGPGSPGSETEFFGALTESAVVRYQVARGISPADGIVSGETRAALQATLEWLAKKEGWTAAGDETAPEPEQAAAAAAPVPALPTRATGTLAEQARRAGEASAARRTSAASGAPVVFDNLLPAAETGARVRIFGYNFNEGGRYRLVVASTSQPFAEAVATSSIALELKVPRAKAGTYSLYVEGENGRSSAFDFQVSGRGRPVVRRVTPDPIKVGDEVVIEGTGFGRTGVTVETSLGEVADLELKGRKITFTSALGADLPKISPPRGGTTTVPITLRVTNAKGSSDPFIVYVAL